jgi:hypothetical protein
MDGQVTDEQMQVAATEVKRACEALNVAIAAACTIGLLVDLDSFTTHEMGDRGPVPIAIVRIARPL